MTTSINRPYLPAVDQIRAIAALLVLFYHGFQLLGARLEYGVDFNPFQHWVRARNPILSIIEEGHTGVALFIVLSGFILSLGSVGHDIDYGRFLKARMLRIYPMLILCLIVAMCIDHGASANALSVLGSLLPLNMGQAALSGPFTNMFWAVAVEFQCYLVFPFLLAFSNRLGTRYLVGVIALAFALRLLAVLATGASARDIGYWTVLGRIDQFCIGMILARLYVRHGLDTLSPRWLIVGALVPALVLVRLNHATHWASDGSWRLIWPTIEGAMWALFIATYLSGAKALPAMFQTVATRIGEISYSVYLLHFAVLYAIMRHGSYIRLTGVAHYDALVTSLLVALPVTLALAALTYAVIERPFLRLRPKYVVAAE